MTLEWDGGKGNADDCEGVRELLLDLHARGRPVWVFLRRRDAPAVLAIGVGASESILNYTLLDGSAAFHSVGDMSRQGYIRFWMEGDLQDHYAWSAISVEQALKAAQEYCATEQRPDGIRWEEDW